MVSGVLGGMELTTILVWKMPFAWMKTVAMTVLAIVALAAAAHEAEAHAAMAPGNTNGSIVGGIVYAEEIGSHSRRRRTVQVEGEEVSRNPPGGALRKV
jgi:hypothetical protein